MGVEIVAYPSSGLVFRASAEPARGVKTKSRHIPRQIRGPQSLTQKSLAAPRHGVNHGVGRSQMGGDLPFRPKTANDRVEERPSTDGAANGPNPTHCCGSWSVPVRKECGTSGRLIALPQVSANDDSPRRDVRLRFQTLAPAKPHAMPAPTTMACWTSSGSFRIRLPRRLRHQPTSSRVAGED